MLAGAGARRPGYGAVEPETGAGVHKLRSARSVVPAVFLLVFAASAALWSRGMELQGMAVAQHQAMFTTEHIAPEFLDSEEKLMQEPAMVVPAAFSTTDGSVLPTVDAENFLTDAVHFINVLRQNCAFYGKPENVAPVVMEQVSLLPSPALTALQRPANHTLENSPMAAPELKAVVISVGDDGDLYVISR